MKPGFWHAIRFGRRAKGVQPPVYEALFANGGFKVEPYYISRIEDSAGKVLYQAEPRLACPACEQPASAPVLATTAAPVEGAPDAGGAATTLAAANATASAAAAPEAVEAPRVFGDDAPEPLRKLASLQGGIGYLPADRIAPRVLSPQNTWLMNSMMHAVATRGTARRTTALGRDDLAGKTGGWTDQLQVFERDGQACLRCRDVVSKVRISGRTAYMCESCQV